MRVIPALALASVLLSSACRTPPSGLVVFCAGDSLTEQGYPRYLRAALGRGGLRAKVLNRGRSGNTSREYLAFLREGIRKLENDRPDIILVELGTNDVRIDGDRVTKEEFEANLRAVVAVFRGFRTRAGEKPEIFLALIPPVPDGTPFPFGVDSPGRVMSEINPTIEALSRDLETGLVDNFSPFAASPGLLPGVHPGPDGYRAMAENWARAILAWSARAGRARALHLSP
jgi:lysophospholipase L1-like esterase